jgi:hypothetical protein
LTDATSEALPLGAQPKKLNLFERWLTLWVGLCIIAGIALGKMAPGVAASLDGITLDVGGAPIVSIPIAICLFFMMYPIMVKIDFAEVVKAGISPCSSTGRSSPSPCMRSPFCSWACCSAGSSGRNPSIW